MAIGMVKGNTLVAIKEEVTEGVALDPTVGADFVQVLQDGLEITPAKETVERTILTNSIGKITPRVSTKSVAGSLPLEYKASGIEGEKPSYDLLLNAGLGNSRQVLSRITSGTGHTTNTIEATAHGLVKGDMFVIIEAGSHHTAFVQSATTDQITFAPAADFTPTDAVELSKSVVYFPANSGQPTFTASVYWADEIKEQAIGNRVSSIALENFSTGQIANLNFSYEGLSFDEADESAPVTPVYQAGLPPLILSATVFQDGVCIDVNEVSLSIENTLAFLTSVKSNDGRISSRIAERVLSGSLNPYKDNTLISNFTLFNENTSFEIILTAQNPTAVAGEFELGSVMGVYLPNCLLTEKVVGDQDGILTESLSFSANRGEDGLEEEVYLGFV